MLTTQQLGLLKYVETYSAVNFGRSPTMREIAAHLGCKSKGQAHRAVEALEDRGAIHRGPWPKRHISIIRRDLLRWGVPIYRASDNQLMGYLP